MHLNEIDLRDDDKWREFLHEFGKEVVARDDGLNAKRSHALWLQRKRQLLETGDAP